MENHKLLSVGSLVLIIVAAVACGGEQQGEPAAGTPVPTPTGTPAPEVVYLPSPEVAFLADDYHFRAFIINTGETDSLAMRWVGGPREATEWQYQVFRLEFRGEGYISRAVGGWVIVPANEARIYTQEITGLEGGRDYRILLRPVVADGVGKISRLHGYVPGPNEYPPIGGGETAVGNGYTKWRVHSGHRSSPLFLITIPIGLWVSVHYVDELSEVWIIEENTSNRLILSREGQELGLEIPCKLDPCYDVAGRLHEIVASVRPLSEDDW